MLIYIKKFDYKNEIVADYLTFLASMTSEAQHTAAKKLKQRHAENHNPMNTDLQRINITITIAFQQTRVL